MNSISLQEYGGGGWGLGEELGEELGEVWSNEQGFSFGGGVISFNKKDQMNVEK